MIFPLENYQSVKKPHNINSWNELISAELSEGHQFTPIKKRDWGNTLHASTVCLFRIGTRTTVPPNLMAYRSSRNYLYCSQGSHLPYAFQTWTPTA